MPIILAGLAWLASAIGTLIAACVSLFAYWLTKRVLITAALCTAFVGVTLTLYASVGVTINLITVNFPPDLMDAMGFMLPTNTYTCLSSVLAMGVVRWLYEIQLKFLNFSSMAA